jgi:hypothetical protein
MARKVGLSIGDETAFFGGLEDTRVVEDKDVLNFTTTLDAVDGLYFPHARLGFSSIQRSSVQRYERSCSKTNRGDSQWNMKQG